jgi:hypothetical protein
MGIKLAGAIFYGVHYPADLKTWIVTNAVRFLEESVTSDPDEEALLYLACMYGYRDEYDAMIACAKKAVRLDEDIKEPTGYATCTTFRHRDFRRGPLLETAEIGERKVEKREHNQTGRRRRSVGTDASSAPAVDPSWFLLGLETKLSLRLHEASA